MRIRLSKFAGVLRVTARDAKQSEKVVSERVTAKSLTTLDIIGLAVLITYQHGLFHGMLTAYDNRKEVDKPPES